ncbi:MAG: BamA/TamA family outer membrane protein [Proteobacteria bacterium]|nr:BamA/TamA family outer membrane protein [Pseudomonadota bacterium]
MFGSLTGQLASKNLDSSEKFYLGGSSGVRAYPASEGGGAEGHLLTLELRWRLPEGITLTAFHDNGRVTVNRHNDYIGAATPNVISLRGSGLALAWQTSSGLNLKLTWARRQGSNPNPTASGNDQDGSLKDNRLWLITSLPL